MKSANVFYPIVLYFCDCICSSFYGVTSTKTPPKTPVFNNILLFSK